MKPDKSAEKGRGSLLATTDPMADHAAFNKLLQGQ